MKNTIYAAVAASGAMMITSGVVALATAATPNRNVVAEQFVGEVINQHFQEALERELLEG